MNNTIKVILSAIGLVLAAAAAPLFILGVVWVATLGSFDFIEATHSIPFVSVIVVATMLGAIGAVSMIGDYFSTH
jgi:hypothetical protein